MDKKSPQKPKMNPLSELRSVVNQMRTYILGDLDGHDGHDGLGLANFLPHCDHILKQLDMISKDIDEKTERTAPMDQEAALRIRKALTCVRSVLDSLHFYRTDERASCLIEELYFFISIAKDCVSTLDKQARLDTVNSGEPSHQ